MTYNQKKSLYENIMREVAIIVKRHLNEGIFDNIEVLDSIKVNLIDDKYVEYRVFKSNGKYYFEIHKHVSKKNKAWEKTDYRYIAECDKEKGMKWSIRPFFDGEQIPGHSNEPNFSYFIVSKYKEKIVKMVQAKLGNKCAQDLWQKIKGIV